MGANKHEIYKAAFSSHLFYHLQQSWGKVVFTCVCDSVHRGVVSQHALQVSRPTPRGEVEGSALGGSPGPHPGGKLRDLAWGVSRPTPGGEGCSPGPHLGGIPACTEADTLPPTQLLLQAVCILLKCILVTTYFYRSRWGPWPPCPSWIRY